MILLNYIMTEVFEIYSKRPSIYYILNAISILTLGFLFVAWQRDLKIQPTYRSFVLILVSLGLVTIVFNMILTASNLVKMYTIDGSLTLSEDEVNIKSIKIAIKDLKKIEIRGNDYKGVRTSDGSGNWMEATYSDNKTIRCRFVIKSKEQRNNLRSILKRWNDAGVNIHS